MTTSAVNTDRVRGRSRMRVALLLGGSGLIMAVLLTVVILWWLMPSWFRLAVIAYAPGVDLAYQAAEADGGDGGLESGLRERFREHALLKQAAERIEHGNQEQRRYAARCIGWIFWRRDSGQGFVLDDPVLRQRLIDGLVAVSRGTEQRCIDTACCALMEMGEVQRLPEILHILDRSKSRWFSLHSFRQHTADPLVTTHLLKWFQANPDYNTLSVLVKQKDPRIEDFIVSVVRSPSYHSALRESALPYLRPALPAHRSVLRSLCTEQDGSLRRPAMRWLAGTDEALDWMLDVRVDPAAEPAHPDAENYLMEHADELSIEQAYRWIAAPPLPKRSRR